MKNILFVSQELENNTVCGIGVIGNLIGRTLSKSKKYNITHILSNSAEKVLNFYNENKPDIIFYNYAGPTMPWVPDNSWKANMECEHVLVYHDGNQNLVDSYSPSQWFDFKYMVTDDPTLDTHNSKTFFTTRRLMVPYSPTKTYVETDYPVIGFQGQLVQHKGLDRLISQVQKEFKKAKIRLHCPHYKYGSGEHIWRNTLQLALANLSNPDIKIEINTEVFTDQQIVDFLSENTVNCYFFDYLDQCGLSSSIDYALASKRPFCISKSFQFRNYWNIEPTILIEKTTIQQVIDNGIKPLEKYYSEYSEENVIKDYERIIDTILSK